jgi:hypothetical protein
VTTPDDVGEPVTAPTRAASYTDRETARWCTQDVVTRNEQLIHRWPPQGTRQRLASDVLVPVAHREQAQDRGHVRLAHMGEFQQHE